MPPELCPNCGAEVPPRARACPECGSDETTGWSERATAQHLDLPDPEFNYDEFVREEFGPPRERRRPSHRLWWAVAMVLLVILAAGAWRGCTP